MDNSKYSSLIKESHKRCDLLDVPKDLAYPRSVLSRQDFSAALKENELLLRVASPVMNGLQDYIINSHFIIALTDKHGTILKITGNDTMRRSVVNGGFVEGANWSEESCGANAIGTAIASDSPILFLASDHYCTFAQRTAGAAAPIYYSSGELLGTIGLVGRIRDCNEHTLGLVLSMSKDIEGGLLNVKANLRIETQNVFLNSILNNMYYGVAAVDNQLRVIFSNKKLFDILKIRDKTVSFTGRTIFDILKNQESSLLQLITENKSLNDRKITVMIDNRAVNISVTSSPITGASGIGYGTLYVIDSSTHTRRIARKFAKDLAQNTFDDIIGESSAFSNVKILAKNAARTTASILLLGESGTGKDILAQAIHNESLRSNGPYIAINCGAIPKDLILSELFGYVDGAFTGAKKGGSVGKFELANGGTLFLDEIGEMPLELQVVLLRALENRSITRVGDSTEIPVDVRIIAATNADILKAVHDGTFREDLYYRLNVITLGLPSLRSRKEDIYPLVRHFYKKYAEIELDDTSMSGEYLNRLLAYDWPGNIRELRNIIERSICLSSDKKLHLQYLPADILQTAEVVETASVPVEKNLPVSPVLPEGNNINASKKERLLYNLSQTHGNITHTAEIMGISRTTVYRQIKQFNIDITQL